MLGPKHSHGPLPPPTLHWPYIIRSQGQGKHIHHHLSYWDFKQCCLCPPNLALRCGTQQNRQEHKIQQESWKLGHWAVVHWWKQKIGEVDVCFQGLTPHRPGGDSDNRPSPDLEERESSFTGGESWPLGDCSCAVVMGREDFSKSTTSWRTRSDADYRRGWSLCPGTCEEIGWWNLREAWGTLSSLRVKLLLQGFPDLMVPFSCILSPPPPPLQLPSLKPKESGVESWLSEAS